MALITEKIVTVFEVRRGLQKGSELLGTYFSSVRAENHVAGVHNGFIREFPALVLSNGHVYLLKKYGPITVDDDAQSRETGR